MGKGVVRSGKGAVRSGKSWWAPRATWQRAGSKEFEEREILIFNIKVVSCESTECKSLHRPSRRLYVAGVFVEFKEFYI